MRRFISALGLLLFLCAIGLYWCWNGRYLQEVDSSARQWGRRPVDKAQLAVSPPAFVWFPQAGIVEWELQVHSAKGKPFYEARVSGINAHRPPQVFPKGQYQWRYRGLDNSGNATAWSSSRSFSIKDGAQAFVLPAREELLAQISLGHPRLYLTKDNIEQWRQKVRGPLYNQFLEVRTQLRMQGIRGRAQMPEPPLNTEGRAKRTPQWRRQHSTTYAMTNRAATGAFNEAWLALIEEDKQAERTALALFDNLLKWDPNGSTSLAQHADASYAYLAGMTRAYTLLYERLSEEQRQRAREVLTERGRALYQSFLDNQYLWDPFDSHRSRTWSQLTELGIALHGDVPEADDWLWYSMNVFANVYPAWADEQGGWHPGVFYQAGYMEALFNWALLVDQTFDFNPFETSASLANMGRFTLYSLPPNKDGAGWGAQSYRHKANSLLNIKTLENFARLSGNGYYADYVRRVREHMSVSDGGLLRGVHDLMLQEYPLPEPLDISTLPPSILFAGTGQVVLNTDLVNASNSVQVQFKSSDFYGTASNGNDANNSFQVWAYGQDMLIKSGVWDGAGSAHDVGWTRSTRANNNITVSGKGQMPLSMQARGQIVDLYLSPELDIVVGEAGGAYFQSAKEPSLLSRFTRSLIFVKPATLVVVDYLQAREPQVFEFWLHASNAFTLEGDGRFSLDVEGVKMNALLVEPQGYQMAMTDQFDPNPNERVKVRQWHLTITPDAPATRVMRFITVYNFASKGSLPAALDREEIALHRGDYGQSVLAFTNESGTRIGITLPDFDADATGSESTLGHKPQLEVTLEREGQAIATASLKLGD